MKICLDFDGVLHDSAHPVPGRRMGPPIPGAYEAVQALVRAGHELVVHTARVRAKDQIDHVWDWLQYYGFHDSMKVAAFKPLADVYVDDKGMHFDDWATTLPVLIGRGGRHAMREGRSRG